MSYIGQGKKHMQKSLRAGEALKSEARDIFPEIKFLRINPTWQESSRASSLSGGDSCAGQIFKRFELKLKTSVIMDFWYRGHSLSESSQAKSRELLSTWGSFTGKQLLSHIEMLGIAADSFRRDGEKAFVAQILSAEVGSIHGKMVLALRWHDLRLRRKFLSIYFSAPQLQSQASGVHEIHFSAPQDEFDKHDQVYAETLRSIQWNQAAPPPMFASSQTDFSVPVMNPQMAAPICIAVA